MRRKTVGCDFSLLTYNKGAYGRGRDVDFETVETREKDLAEVYVETYSSEGRL